MLMSKPLMPLKEAVLRLETLRLPELALERVTACPLINEADSEPTPERVSVPELEPAIKEGDWPS